MAATGFNREMDLDVSRLFTHAQLVAGGLHPNEIRSKLRSGELARIRRGVYRTGGAVDPLVEHQQLVWAMLLHVDGTNVVSHQSAAVLHGLPIPNEDLARACMTRRTSGHSHSSTQLKVRDSPLDELDVMLLDGVPVTTLARTTADLARTLSYAWGVAVCDAALRIGLQRVEMLDALGRHPHLRGQSRARQVAAFADARSESPAESMSRVAMARAAIPIPQLQYEMFDANGEFVARPDFAWPELRLVGEVDGRIKYGQLLRPGQSADAVIMAEKRREELIRQLGWWIVRWDWNTATHPHALGALLRRAMGVQRPPIVS